ncbi:MAG: D-alanine--D-alanine ligase [Lachnospiraceae bacterium]|nr:D-alanine--D-alanine ligase [Lachnospiraceae bacterium]
MDKKTVAVIFGGQSSEHDISCISAATVIENINSDKYDTILIGITKHGAWKLVKDVASIKDGSWEDSGITAIVSPEQTKGAVLIIENGKAQYRKVDVAIPALHGLYGEDGTIQGLFELAGIPYVGCGVLASAVSMDKLYTKQIVKHLGIRQAKYVPVLYDELSDLDACVAKVEKELSYPVFVKPSNAGSSCGVTKAYDEKALREGLLTASEFDRKILVEENITGRELECAVLGGKDKEASGVGEILAAADFYDFDAKYNNEESRTVIGPELPEGKAEEIRSDAIRIFRALDGFGLSRVDFFLENGTNEVVFNEINTFPGFTSISMYPMLWGAKGLDKKELVDKLIDTAFERRRSYNA